jgi:hypothetical protein
VSLVLGGRRRTGGGDSLGKVTGLGRGFALHRNKGCVLVEARGVEERQTSEGARGRCRDAAASAAGRHMED